MLSVMWPSRGKKVVLSCLGDGRLVGGWFQNLVMNTGTQKLPNLMHLQMSEAIVQVNSLFRNKEEQ